MARELQEILNSGEVTGQTMHPGYTPSGEKDVSVNDHNHSGVYEPANSNIQQHIARFNNPHGVSKSHVGLANVDNTSDLAKPVSNATQTALNAKENADPAIQSHLINTSNPHGVQAGDVGLDNVNNTTDLNKPVSNATQTALNGKSDTGHDHNADYYLKSEHVISGGSPSQANSPIILDANGQIDPTLISFPTLSPQGPWTPSGGNEYPDLTGIPNGSFWTVTAVVVGYTFLTGDLIGEEASDGDIMLITVNGWSLITSQVDPTIYLRLDGTSSMQADLAIGNNKVTSMANGVALDDAASVGQLSSGLSGKSDTGHNHDADYDSLGSANVVQGALTTHTGQGDIHYPQSAISITENQISDLGDYLTSDQEGGVGVPLGNFIRLTQAQYDGLGSKNPTTVYFIVG